MNMATLANYTDFFTNAYKGKCLNSYCSYVNRIEIQYQKNNHNQSIADLIDNAINKKIDNPVEWLLTEININNLLNTIAVKPKTRKSYRSGFKTFASVVLGVFYANTWMSLVTDDDLLCSIVAQNALFPSDKIVDAVRNGHLGTKVNIKASSVPGYKNPFASWDYMSHYRDNSLKKGTQVSDQISFPGTLPYKIADDNTCANQYIKNAIKISIEDKYKIKLNGAKFRDYEACHVWDIPSDRLYYASIANLVLLPRALAQLTDHNDAVKELLRYEVYIRFGFIPKGQKPPTKPPKKYNTYNWRAL